MTLLLDFDGTLINQNRLNAYSNVVGKYAASPPDGFAKVLYERDKALCAKEIYDRAEVFNFDKYMKFFPNFIPKELCEAFWDEVCALQTLRDGCEETLKRLKDEGHTLICATDNDGPNTDKLKRIQASGLFNYFDEIFIGSVNVPHPKGDSPYLDYIIERLDIDPRRCVMIGDKAKTDLLPAKAAGISSILVINEEYKCDWPVAITSLTELPRTIKGLMSEVFISYSHSDEDIVIKIESALKDEGTKIWRDKSKIPAGESISHAITEAIRSIPIFLLVITRNSLKSQWVQHEIDLAVNSRIKEGTKIIPVLAKKLKHSELPLGINNLKCVDLYLDFDKGISEIQNAIRLSKVK
jgi:FMN phosphatase YigB (HAD superfamily)